MIVQKSILSKPHVVNIGTDKLRLSLYGLCDKVIIVMKTLGWIRYV